MFNIYVDQIWLMPMYTHNLNYTKYISKVDTKISPYVWDSTIIDLYNIQNNINTKYNPLSEKLDIVIMEPNISIHKTSLVPLLIAEEFYSRNPDKLGQIYLISSPDDIDQKLVT